MPVFPESTPDEATQLLRFLDAQRQGLRAAVSGLTEEQARSTPTASSMSLSSLLEHATAVERRWVVAAVADRPEGLWPVEDWDAEWRLLPEDTVEHLLAAFAAAAEETATVVAGVPDLAAPCAQPDSAEFSVRWVLLHLIEEHARHAGHADVVRESIDGATADQLGG
ncbi:DinB family protein [Modestobacter versicolor]|uniref:DinB family protein n=1 Tax=Modestobacter versicolor TaxID=429133 RepID=UPI0034DFB7C6